MILDECAWMFWVEGVFNLDGDILDADGINGWRINDLGTKVTEFHRFDITKFVDGIGTLDNLGVGSHETVNISPYFQYIGIECCGYNSCSIIATSTSQISSLMCITIAGNETRNYIHGFVIQSLEGFRYQFLGQFGVKNVLSLLLFRANKVATVHANTILHHCCYNVRRQAFTIRNNSVFCFL